MHVPARARAYVALVAIAGVGACAVSARALSTAPDVHGLWLLLLCCGMVLSTSLSLTKLRIVELSLDVVAATAALAIVGPAGTVIVSAASAFARSQHKTPMVKRVFNFGQLSLAGAAAGGVYAVMHGPVGNFDGQSFPRELWVVFASVAAWSAVNVLLVSGVVALTEKLSLTAVCRSLVAGDATNVVYGAFGLMLAVLWIDYTPVSGLLLLMPLLSARWALKQHAEQQKAYDATLRSLITAIEIKDGYTRGHSERVSQIAVLIARQAHLPEHRVDAVRYGALLHDVGKTGIPSRILAKHGKLTDEEFEVIKTHPDRGVQMLDGIDFLSDSIAGVYHHHERMDGRGYPLGLAGDEVPEIARIIMVADAFDAMTSTRSYRPARSTDKAIVELRRCQGDQFDPRMVDALVAGVDKHGWQGDPEPFSATPITHEYEIAPAAAGVIPAQADAAHS